MLHLYGSQSVLACMDMCMYFFAGVTALVGIIGGMTMQLALLHDLTCLLAVPLLLAYMAYTKLYAVQLHYTLLMWRLMRGNRSVQHRGRWQLLCLASRVLLITLTGYGKRSVVRNPVLAICRDALAVLRRQYGFEGSPRKRKQTHCCRHEDQDGLALEQVRMGLLHPAALLVRINVQGLLCTADDCWRSSVHTSSLLAANNMCLLRTGPAVACICHVGLLGASDSV